MAETRDAFLWRLREIGWTAWDENEGSEGYVDEALTAAVEAGYAHALRDVIAAFPTYSHEDENGKEYWLPDALRHFAKVRGIDIDQ